jgi:hypothetical protein
MQKEKLSNGVRFATAKGHKPPTNASDRRKTGATLLRGYEHQCVDGLNCRIQFDCGKPVKWRPFLAPETFPAGIVLRSCRRLVGEKYGLNLTYSSTGFWRFPWELL